MRKYVKGNKINNLEHFSHTKFIWDARTDKVYHQGWCQSWQFRYVKIGIQNGWFFEARTLEDDKKIKENSALLSGFSNSLWI